VLLHVSILMTIGDFGRRSNTGSASRTRPLNSGLFLQDKAHTNLSERQTAIASAFSDYPLATRLSEAESER
jgi:hypothetical protein